MTNPHAKAVEAALLAVVNRERAMFGIAPVRAIPQNITPDTRLALNTQAAITAYLATMRAEGWVMVPSAATVDMVTAAMSRPDYGASTTLFYGEIYRAMIEAAMLKGAGDGQG